MKATAALLFWAVSLCAHGQNQNQAPPKPSGIALNDIRTTVRPQDDFFGHVNGNWLARTEIPADRSSWGLTSEMEDQMKPQLRAIIEAADADQNKPAGSDAQRIGDFYASYMDEATLQQRASAPLQPELARIAALTDKRGIPALIAHFQREGIATVYGVGIRQDNRDSTSYVVEIHQEQSGMPDQDYYLKTSDPKLAAIRLKYQRHVASMLALAGDTKAAANTKSKAIVALETALAKVQWSQVAQRDPIKSYNKVPVSKLSTLAPGYDWQSWLDQAGLAGKIDHVIVAQPSYFKGYDKVLRTTPLAVWKSYFQWNVIHAYAGYLSHDFEAEDFAFYNTVLNEVPTQQPRWKRGIDATSDLLGETLGKLYVAQHFPPERKAQTRALVDKLLAAFRESITTLDWMSEPTRKQALVKLDKMTIKIGYPDVWHDYTALKIKRDDLSGNVRRAHAFYYDREIAKLGQPIDRSEWTMTPQAINASYNPELNEIVFPAAILQPSFFDANADDAANYGAIGAVIGHEISHGFDDEGAKYDGDGNLHDWWTAADHRNFAARTKMLVKQYSAFSPVPGYFVNGELTLGENIADNSGLAIAYRAYQLSLGGKPAPVLDGLTGEQRFYVAFGQSWRNKSREAQEIVYLKVDPHAPDNFRTNGSVRNQPGFYNAFGVKPGDKLYLAPKDRVRIW